MNTIISTDALDNLRRLVEEAAGVFESGAKHNSKQGRTVFAHEQQDRAKRLRDALAKVDAAACEQQTPAALEHGNDIHRTIEIAARIFDFKPHKQDKEDLGKFVRFAQAVAGIVLPRGDLVAEKWAIYYDNLGKQSYPSRFMQDWRLYESTAEANAEISSHPNSEHYRPEKVMIYANLGGTANSPAQVGAAGK